MPHYLVAVPRKCNQSYCIYCHEANLTCGAAEEVSSRAAVDLRMQSGFPCMKPARYMDSLTTLSEFYVLFVHKFVLFFNPPPSSMRTSHVDHSKEEWGRVATDCIRSEKCLIIHIDNNNKFKETERQMMMGTGGIQHPSLQLLQLFFGTSKVITDDDDEEEEWRSATTLNYDLRDSQMHVHSRSHASLCIN